MDGRRCMIVDLEKEGRDMFVTEKVAYINKGTNGLWTVRFATSGRFFKYNTSRLLYMTRPESVTLDKRGLYVGKRRIADAAEILRFTDGAHTFYRVIEVVAPTEARHTGVRKLINGKTQQYELHLIELIFNIDYSEDKGLMLNSIWRDTFVNDKAFRDIGSTDGQDEQIRIGLKIRKIWKNRCGKPQSNRKGRMSRRA